MGNPAARLTDMHVCPLSTGPVPHVGGPIVSPGAPTVIIGGLPAARVGDMATCVGPPDFIAPPGAPTVLIGGMPAARMGDMTVHGGRVVLGCFTVLIGTAGASGSGLCGGVPAGPTVPSSCMQEAKKKGLPFVAMAPHESEGLTPKPMDKSKFPKEREFLDSPEGKEAFPNLGNNYEVLGPSTPDKKYNCIAHTLGNDEGPWQNPKQGTADNPLSGMDALYAEKGYKRSSEMDFTAVPGKRKIVVYATKNPDGSILNVTHGAIQDDDGRWTSKLGRGPLIRHETPDALNNPDVYGEPVAVYEK